MLLIIILKFSHMKQKTPSPYPDSYREGVNYNRLLNLLLQNEDILVYKSSHPRHLSRFIGRGLGSLFRIVIGSAGGIKGSHETNSSATKSQRLKDTHRRF